MGKLLDFRFLKKKLNTFAKFLQKNVKFLFHKIGRKKEIMAAYRIGPQNCEKKFTIVNVFSPADSKY